MCARSARLRARRGRLQKGGRPLAGGDTGGVLTCEGVGLLNIPLLR